MNTRLNLSYVKLLFNHLQISSVNIGVSVCGLRERGFLWTLIFFTRVCEGSNLSFRSWVGCLYIFLSFDCLSWAHPISAARATNCLYFVALYDDDLSKPFSASPYPSLNIYEERFPSSVPPLPPAPTHWSYDISKHSLNVMSLQAVDDYIS